MFGSKYALAVLAVAMHTATDAEGSTGVKVKFASKEYDLDTGEFIFTFGDGEEKRFNVDSLPDEMKRQLMFHGFGQKAGDSYAGLSKSNNFTGAKSNVQDVYDQLARGEWRGGRDSEARPRLDEVAQAIARIKGLEFDKAKAAVQEAYDSGEEGQAKIKAWRAHPKIKAEIAAIRAEKARADLEAQGEGAGEITL